MEDPINTGINSARKHAGTLLVGMALASVIVWHVGDRAWTYLADREERFEAFEERLNQREIAISERERSVNSAVLEIEKSRLELAHARTMHDLDVTRGIQKNADLSALENELSQRAREMANSEEAASLRSEGKELVAKFIETVAEYGSSNSCARQKGRAAGAPTLARIAAIGAQLPKGNDFSMFAADQQEKGVVWSSDCDTKVEDTSLTENLHPD